jgi:predicted enzyme related to lactoylglutathione lyase
MTEKKFGVISWHDLTVPNATEVKDFYAAVLDMKVQDIPVKDYHDYALDNADGETLGGICHARGQNAAQPPQWLMYVNVRDLDASLGQVSAKGGKIIRPKWTMKQYGDFAVIQDPGGAYMGLFQPA